MEAQLIELAGLLRQNGVRVGPGEVADAARAVALLGLEDRAAFRSAVRMCLVKRAPDVPTFDRLFELYFTGAAALLDSIEGSLLKRIEEEGFLSGDELAMVAATLGALVGTMTPLARAAIEGDGAGLARLFRGAALALDFSGFSSPLQQGFYTRRLLAAAGAEKAEQDLAEISRALGARGLSAEGLDLVGRRIGEAMRRVEEAARAAVELQARMRLRSASSRLADRPFAELSTEEIDRVMVAVRRLAERLKTRLGRRQRAQRKGALHFRRTLRKNLSWGGVPARLAFRSRRPERPEVVVLCDLSDSVRAVSRMMLLFVHTLQALFQRVRSFAFVSDIAEITDLLRAADASQAIDLAMVGEVLNLHANSNYGRALASFVEHSRGSICRRTTVMVIGDGRNNFNEANVWALREIKQKAGRVIWICPEDRRAWGLGDSEMLRYSRFCDRVAVVQSLSDLAEVADELVPRPA